MVHAFSVRDSRVFCSTEAIWKVPGLHHVSIYTPLPQIFSRLLRPRFSQQSSSAMSDRKKSDDESAPPPPLVSPEMAAPQNSWLPILRRYLKASSSDEAALDRSNSSSSDARLTSYLFETAKGGALPKISSGHLRPRLSLQYSSAPPPLPVSSEVAANSWLPILNRHLKLSTEAAAAPVRIYRPIASSSDARLTSFLFESGGDLESSRSPKRIYSALPQVSPPPVRYLLLLLQVQAHQDFLLLLLLFPDDGLCILVFSSASASSEVAAPQLRNSCLPVLNRYFMQSFSDEAIAAIRSLDDHIISSSAAARLLTLNRLNKDIEDYLCLLGLEDLAGEFKHKAEMQRGLPSVDFVQKWIFLTSFWGERASPPCKDGEITKLNIGVEEYLKCLDIEVESFNAQTASEHILEASSLVGKWNELVYPLLELSPWKEVLK